MAFILPLIGAGIEAIEAAVAAGAGAAAVAGAEAGAVGAAEVAATAGVAEAAGAVEVVGGAAGAAAEAGGADLAGAGALGAGATEAEAGIGAGASTAETATGTLTTTEEVGTTIGEADEAIEPVRRGRELRSLDELKDMISQMSNRVGQIRPSENVSRGIADTIEKFDFSKLEPGRASRIKDLLTQYSTASIDESPAILRQIMAEGVPISAQNLATAGIAPGAVATEDVALADLGFAGEASATSSPYDIVYSAGVAEPGAEAGAEAGAGAGSSELSPSEIQSIKDELARLGTGEAEAPTREGLTQEIDELLTKGEGKIGNLSDADAKALRSKVLQKIDMIQNDRGFISSKAAGKLPIPDAGPAGPAGSALDNLPASNEFLSAEEVTNMQAEASRLSGGAGPAGADTGAGVGEFLPRLNEPLGVPGNPNPPVPPSFDLSSVGGPASDAGSELTAFSDFTDPLSGPELPRGGGGGGFRQTLGNLAERFNNIFENKWVNVAANAATLAGVVTTGMSIRDRLSAPVDPSTTQHIGHSVVASMTPQAQRAVQMQFNNSRASTPYTIVGSGQTVPGYMIRPTYDQGRINGLDALSSIATTTNAMKQGPYRTIAWSALPTSKAVQKASAQTSSAALPKEVTAPAAKALAKAMDPCAKPPPKPLTEAEKREKEQKKKDKQKKKAKCAINAELVKDIDKMPAGTSANKIKDLIDRATSPSAVAKKIADLFSDKEEASKSEESKMRDITRDTRRIIEV